MKKNCNIIYCLATAFLFMFLLVPDVLAAGCPLGVQVTKDLQGILKIMKIAAPLLCVGFSAFDAIKAVTKGDAAADMKQVVTKFGKRMMYAVILFFLPVLVEAVLEIAGITSNCDLDMPTETTKIMIRNDLMN